MQRVEAGGLKVDKELHDFIVEEALPGTGISADAFWSGLGGIVRDLSPKVAALLKQRDALQDEDRRLAQVAWRRGRFEQREYEDFLHEIGYLQPEPPDFADHDREMSTTRSRGSPARSSSCRCRTRATR